MSLGHLSTAVYRNQIFSCGARCLAFQCHPEVTAGNLERWFIGHACEIGAPPGIGVPALRRETALPGPALEHLGRLCLGEWLAACPNR